MKNILLLVLLASTFISCKTIENSAVSTRQIPVGPGPEDMLIDRTGEVPRILVSCADRREGQERFGEIVSFTPSTQRIDTLTRIGMPDTLKFHPHGIFLDSLSDPPVLYVISHEDETGFHPVYLWEVHGDTLRFLELVSSPLVYSPNALTLGADGVIYVVNDAGKRGNMMEKALKLNRANLVLLKRDPDGKWQAEIAAEKLGYPAGINRIGNTLYAGDAVNHILHVYTIEGNELQKQEPVEGLKGNDNIRVIDGMLYLTGHIKPLKFIGHAGSPEKLSPVEVWRMDPQTGKIESLFITDGSLISAGSTALYLDGKLYISQVFDPFILEVELDSQ
jgi:hypothetical protein